MITTLSKVRERAGLAVAEVQWDAQLTGMIKMVLDLFNLETARRLQRTVDHVQMFDAGSKEVSLECYPLETITKWELYLGGVWVEQTEVQALPGRGGVVHLERPLASAGQFARVTYTGGYVLPDPAGSPGQFPLPDILEIGAIETVIFWWQMKSQVGLFRVEGADATYKEVADTRWVPWVRSMLRKYRRMGA